MNSTLINETNTENVEILDVSEVNDFEKIKQQLFPNQRRAIAFIDDYINNWDDNQYAGLVRMPTGTGKTGITAIAASYFDEIKNTLVVVPSVGLVDQMLSDLSYKFWKDDVKLQPSGGPKKIHRLFPHSVFECTEFLDTHKDKGAIVVTTPQTLATIYKHNWLMGLSEVFSDERISQLSNKQPDKDYSDGYIALRDKIDLVIFDEGHREPAKTWAKAVRRLGKPILLMSATPYRNDLRLFRIGPLPKKETSPSKNNDQGEIEDKKKKNYRLEYRYQDAIKDKLIREVKFQRVDGDWKDNPKEFVLAVAKAYFDNKDELISSGIQNPKMILRCNSFDNVKAIHEEFVCQEQNKRSSVPDYKPARVIAIHSTYQQTSRRSVLKDCGEQASEEILKTQFGQPPQRDENDEAIFWIHENMLAEGVDIPEFALLAFYNEYANSRSLVQQIGRIIRTQERR